MLQAKALLGGNYDALQLEGRQMLRQSFWTLIARSTVHTSAYQISTRSGNNRSSVIDDLAKFP